MKSKSTMAAVALLASVFVGAAGNTQGCGGWYSGEASGHNFKLPVGPQTIKGEGIFGQILSTLPLTFPFNAAIPSSTQTDEQITAVYLNTLALRILTDADYGPDGKALPDRLKDESLIGDCSSVPQGQNLDFIKSFNVMIQKDGSSQAVRIAHYCNSRSTSDCATADMPAVVSHGVCGFFMSLDIDPSTGMAYNLKDFLPNYTVTTTASGTAPVNDVTIGGFVSVDWNAPDVELSPNQAMN